MTEDQKQAFKAMRLEDQLAALYDMMGYVRAELASVKKAQIGFDQDLTEFQQELREVRQRREAMEKKQMMDTNEKIERALNKRFDTWVWFRDRVLPNIISLITLAVLYLTFGGKLP